MTLILTLGVAVSLLLLGLGLRRRAHARVQKAAAALEAQAREAARRAEEAWWDNYRKQWAAYDAAETARIAALEAEGPPAPWRVRQDQHSGKWLRDEAWLYIPSPLRSPHAMPPSVRDIDWAWRKTAGVFDTLEQAQAFTASGVDPHAYLLNASGVVVATLPAEMNDEEDDA